MTVKELIAVLSKLPKSALVVLAKDGEGNSFSPLSDAEKRHYVAETTYSGYLENPEEEPDGVTAVVLWPTN